MRGGNGCAEFFRSNHTEIGRVPLCVAMNGRGGKTPYILCTAGRSSRVATRAARRVPNGLKLVEVYN